jgi:hypothetical protein
MFEWLLNTSLRRKDCFASPQAAKIFIKGNFCREALEVNILKGSASPEHIAQEDKLSCKRFGSPE